MEKIKYLSLREIQLEELEMLKQTINFCNENGLKYYICGGTLLGAIRHKGFIPWDDDIDIAMPREDYEKFQNLALNNNKKIGKLIVSSHKLNGLRYPYCKIINPAISILSAENDEDKNLWIDIFPFDKIPEDSKKRIKMYKKLMRYKKLLILSKLKVKSIIKNNPNKFESALKILLKYIIKIFMTNLIVKKAEKLSSKYNSTNSKYVGVSIWGYGQRETMDESNLKTKTVQFEGMKVNGFVGYDKYLTNLYGDYMKLPPKNKRKQHGIKAIKEK